MKAVETTLHEQNRAIYLPAISKGYAVEAVRQGQLGGTGLSCRDLDFLDPRCSLFHYPYGLYSAGQAAPAGGGPPTADMVSQRDRDATIILGDSGGYQIQTGAIKFTDKTAGRMMRWMEAVSDWSMILDFPTGGIAGGALAPHIARLRAEGHDLDALNAGNRLGIDYNACLLQTKINNDFFVANRTPGSTRFLNVLQGRDERESRYWYEQVKHYPFEGWAFAGAHQDNFAMVVARLIDLRDDGRLESMNWLHVLGSTTLPVGVLLTAVQRAVRQHVNPNFQISFDAASPFVLAANGTAISSSIIDGSAWSINTVGTFDLARGDEGKALHDALEEHQDRKENGKAYRGTRTAIGRRATLADLRDLEASKVVKGKVRMGMMTSAGPLILMNHNVEALLDAHDQAHDMMFNPSPLGGPLDVPLAVKVIATMIELIFAGGHHLAAEPLDAREAIKSWRPYLAALRDG